MQMLHKAVVVPESRFVLLRKTLELSAAFTRLGQVREKCQARFFDMHVEPAPALMKLVNTQAGLEVAAATTGIDDGCDNGRMQSDPVDVVLFRG